MISEEEFEEKHPSLIDALAYIDYFVENGIDEDDTYYVRKYVKADKPERALEYFESLKRQIDDLFWAADKIYDYLEKLTKEKDGNGHLRV